MIAIVGGGISGLAAAYELTRRAVPFTLFETTDRLGGLIRTEHVDGFTIEAGADSMLAHKHGALDLCAELGIDHRLQSMSEPRGAFVLRDRSLYPLPSPGLFGIPGTWRDLIRYDLLPPAARARMALEIAVPPRTSPDDESVGSFFRRRFGKASVDLIAQPLIGGIHAGDVERLSAKRAIPRLVEVERSGRRVLPWIQHSRRVAAAGGAFRSLASGMGELVDAIRARLPGDAIRLQSPVTALTRRNMGWQLTVNDEDSSEADAVILACPAHAAARLLDRLDSDAGRLCASVPYVSTASVALVWPRDAVAHPLNGSGFVVARTRSSLRITACTWVSSKWPGRAPERQALLRAYVGGGHDPTAVDLSDDQLADLAVRELSAVLSISGAPALTRVYRWRNAGAQHVVGHAERMATIDTRLEALGGVFVTGSGFRSIGIPDCIADGRAVAAAAESFVNGNGA